MALPQIASFRMPLGSTKPTTESLNITGRKPITVDRIQAFVTVQPAADGTMPTRDAVRMVERTIRARIALDRNDRNVLTIGDMPLCIFNQLDQGPVAVPPFVLKGDEQPTIKLTINPNVFQTDAIKNYGPAEVEVVFWGQEA